MEINRPQAPAAFAASANAPATTSRPAAAFERYRPYVLSILRIMVGLLFLEHGLAKVFGFPPHGHMPVYPDVEWFAGRIETVGGASRRARVFTRLPPSSCRAKWRSPISSATRRAASFR